MAKGKGKNVNPFAKSAKKEDLKHLDTKQEKLSTNDKIKELEAQIAKTKYNKKTQHAIGLMKAKLAKLKEKAENRAGGGGGGKQEGYSVRKSGDGTVILVGFPSVVFVSPSFAASDAAACCCSDDGTCCLVGDGAPSAASVPVVTASSVGFVAFSVPVAGAGSCWVGVL